MALFSQLRGQIGSEDFSCNYEFRQDLVNALARSGRNFLHVSASFFSKESEFFNEHLCGHLTWLWEEGTLALQTQAVAVTLKAVTLSRVISAWKKLLHTWNLVLHFRATEGFWVPWKRWLCSDTSWVYASGALITLTSTKEGKRTSKTQSVFCKNSLWCIFASHSLQLFRSVISFCSVPVLAPKHWLTVNSIVFDACVSLIHVPRSPL